MKDFPQKATTWCEHCQQYALITATQPYRDLTYRLEIYCQNHECDERGLLYVIEVKE